MSNTLTTTDGTVATSGIGANMVASLRAELDDEESPYRYSNKVILNALKKATKKLNWGFTITSSSASSNAISIDLTPNPTEEDELWIAELAAIYARLAKNGMGTWRDGDVSWDGRALRQQEQDFLQRAAWHQPSTNSDTYYIKTKDMRNRDKTVFGVERELIEYYDDGAKATKEVTFDVTDSTGTLVD